MKNDERNWRKKQFENHNILNNKQKEEIKKAFDMFDGNGSGIIEASNLKGTTKRSINYTQIKPHKNNKK